MQRMIAALMVPLLLLNLLGGIASGIWLAVLGEWWAIGYGAAFLFSQFLLALVLVPGMIFLVPAASLVKRGLAILAAPFVFLTNLYTFAVRTAWCLFVFWLFVSRAFDDTLIPLVIWSYGAAMGPWMYMAQKEEQAGGEVGMSHVSNFFAQVAYVVIGVLTIFSSTSLFDLMVLFVGLMSIGMVVQFVIGFALLLGQWKST